MPAVPGNKRTSLTRRPKESTCCGSVQNGAQGAQGVTEPKFVVPCRIRPSPLLRLTSRQACCKRPRALVAAVSRSRCVQKPPPPPPPARCQLVGVVLSCAAVDACFCRPRANPRSGQVATTAHHLLESSAQLRLLRRHSSRRQRRRRRGGFCAPRAPTSRQLAVSRRRRHPADGCAAADVARQRCHQRCTQQDIGPHRCSHRRLLRRHRSRRQHRRRRAGFGALWAPMSRRLVVSRWRLHPSSWCFTVDFDGQHRHQRCCWQGIGTHEVCHERRLHPFNGAGSGNVVGSRRGRQNGWWGACDPRGSWKWPPRKILQVAKSPRGARVWQRPSIFFCH